jgi:hypothetical protein
MCSGVRRHVKLGRPQGQPISFMQFSACTSSAFAGLKANMLSEEQLVLPIISLEELLPGGLFSQQELLPCGGEQSVLPIISLEELLPAGLSS